jgi:UDP-N-acetylmuramate--alanine ligase
MHIYFSGIGGSGLCPLANLALDCGFLVSGSDIEESQNLTDLRKRGVSCQAIQNLEEIDKLDKVAPIDWIIHTSALPSNHPHLVFAKQNNIKITKRHDLINYVVKTKNLKLIAVSGTHGKTTTTGMLIWLFKSLGIPVSYLIGANISFGLSGEYAKGSKYFVYECDEFDRNFLNFKPFLSIIPSLDYDHADTYKTDKEYVESFVQFFSQSEFVISLKSVNDYMHQVFAKYNLSFDKMLSDKTIYFLKDDDQGTQEHFTNPNWIGLAGLYIRRNAMLVVLAMSMYVNQEQELQILEAIRKFPGTSRRFERLGTNLYSDYGHHPVEIVATINIAKELVEINKSKNPLSEQKIVLIYQPHQNIRQRDRQVQLGYSTCFAGVDEVYWLDTFLSREGDLPVLTSQELIGFAQKKQKKNPSSQTSFYPVKMDSSLVQKIHTHQKNNNLVIVMGAGSVDKWARESLVLDFVV